MSFTQIEFFIFFFILLILLYIFKSNLIKKILILTANFYFYACFDYRFLALLICLSIMTFFVGKWLQELHSDLCRKVLLISGIAINAGILIIFKYYNFFIENINDLWLLNHNNLAPINILIPLGVSFYTFRFISYLSDRFKGEDDSTQYQLVDFLLYGTFFPIIISGPISKATTFLPQIKTIKFSIFNLYLGLRRFIIGLFLKVFIADRIAPYINYIYLNYKVFNSISIWVASLAYSLQIYCDFAGYSSMAIGLALILGFTIEENFNFPYLAKSISGFWVKWHITLSSWIKEYLYIPLGGNRKGKFRKDINLITAMTLCGLWHGAAWTFVLWGFLHGILLVLNHRWKELKFLPPIKQQYHFYYAFIARCLTFFSVTLCWIFFRSQSINQALQIIKKMFLFSTNGVGWYHPFVVLSLLSAFLFHVLYILRIEFISLPVFSRFTPAILLCLLWLVIVFYPAEFHPFVYERF